MAIAFDSTGSATGNSVTTLTVDITSAAVGAVAYCYIQIGSSELAGVTMTGWVKLLDVNEISNGSHYAFFRRTKQSGDTTFGPTWAGAQGATAVWSSYTGLNTTYPDEGVVSARHESTSASYTTPTQAPADNTRWALACAGGRSTTSAETWTAPGTLTLRTQAVNSATRWSPAVIADSNGAVAATAASYTFTLSAAEPHGGAVLAYLIPSTSANPAYPPPTLVRQAVQRAANW